MREYGWTRDYVLYELPCIEGRAYLAWAVENNGLAPAERETDGYVAQEAYRLMGMG